MMNYIALSDHCRSRDAVEAVHELLTIFIQPDLRIEVEETARLRNEARSGVASIKRLYAPDDTIIEKNATITQDHIEALMRSCRTRRPARGGKPDKAAVADRLLGNDRRFFSFYLRLLCSYAGTGHF